ncbi:MAG: NifB/NifX family molybdenum-iron cluster-binding protein [Candidatus Hodarchaeota archaeon]
MSIERIAIPADAEQGLESPISGHFGHCPIFIVSTVENGEIVNVETLRNLPHGSCAEPVKLLADNGVKVLITGGMGMRPYMVTQQLGISVVLAQGATVGEALENYLKGSLTIIGSDSLCGGGGKHH